MILQCKEQFFRKGKNKIIPKETQSSIGSAAVMN